MFVGYARVSTTEQNEERQLVTLDELGAEKIFLDKLSGKNTKRPKLQEMLDFVREGDTVVVSEYSRLARSTKDLLDIIEGLKAKKVAVISHAENFDTSTPQGELMLTIFAGLAEFERKIMLQRQREGIAVAQAAGKYKGRQQKQKPQNWEDLYELYRTRQLTGKALVERCEGVSRAVVYKWIKEEREN